MDLVSDRGGSRTLPRVSGKTSTTVLPMRTVMASGLDAGAADDVCRSNPVIACGVGRRRVKVGWASDAEAIHVVRGSRSAPACARPAGSCVACEDAWTEAVPGGAARYASSAAPGRVVTGSARDTCPSLDRHDPVDPGALLARMGKLGSATPEPWRWRRNSPDPMTEPPMQTRRWRPPRRSRGAGRTDGGDGDLREPEALTRRPVSHPTKLKSQLGRCHRSLEAQSLRAPRWERPGNPDSPDRS